MKSIFAFGLALLVLAVPCHAQGTTSPVLVKLLTEFVAAYNEKNAERVASFYAEDGVLMPSDAPMIRGRANIKAVFQKQFEQRGVLQLGSMESEISGDRAVAAGVFTLTISRGVAVPTGVRRGGTLTGAGTAAQVFAAKYLTVFKRVGNDWKIAYDMQNADQPPPK